MSGRAVALSAIVGVAAALVLGAPAGANEAAHRIAEKFAGEAESTGAKKKKEEERKAAEARKREAEKAEAEKRREAQRKAEAARKALEAKHHAAAKAAEDARRAAERQQADEAEMLARARREDVEMKAAEEEARLTEEARRLIVEAERERAKAEELLATQGHGPQPTRTAAEAESAKSEAEQARLMQRRAEETRRLAEKLRRVRQIREARLTAQAARREAEARQIAAVPATAESPLPPPAPPVMTPPSAAPATQATDPNPQPASTEAVAPASPAPPLVTAAPAATRPARTWPEPRAADAGSPGTSMPAAQPASTTALPTARASETRFTVLVVLTPGTYGIRRNGPKVADPVLCTREGCYVSAGADRPAVFMRGRKALGIGNTWGGRAGACRQALGCVFRSIELGPLPGYLQPVDMHIFKHDRRPPHLVLADSACGAEAGRIFCRHGIYADTYTMWVIPESLATAAGTTALQKAVSEGLNGPRSAELVPNR
jgi:colicin import membrane protein